MFDWIFRRAVAARTAHSQPPSLPEAPLPREMATVTSEVTDTAPKRNAFQTETERKATLRDTWRDKEQWWCDSMLKLITAVTFIEWDQHRITAVQSTAYQRPRCT